MDMPTGGGRQGHDVRGNIWVVSEPSKTDPFVEAAFPFPSLHPKHSSLKLSVQVRNTAKGETC